MAIDFEVLAARGDQGAALQAQVAPQLKMSPSTIFFIQNIEYLDPSGAAVLLALVGACDYLASSSKQRKRPVSGLLYFLMSLFHNLRSSISKCSSSISKCTEPTSEY